MVKQMRRTMATALPSAVPGSRTRSRGSAARSPNTGAWVATSSNASCPRRSRAARRASPRSPPSRAQRWRLLARYLSAAHTSMPDFSLSRYERDALIADTQPALVRGRQRKAHRRWRFTSKFSSGRRRIRPSPGSSGRSSGSSFSSRCSGRRPPARSSHHITAVCAAGDHGDCTYGRGAVEASGLAGAPVAGLESVPVGGGTIAVGWLEQAVEMPRRIATTERFLIREPRWSGRAHAYAFAAEA